MKELLAKILNYLTDEPAIAISSLASIGTLFSVIISFFTLRTIKKQSKNALKPELFLAKSLSSDCYATVKIEEEIKIIYWLHHNDLNKPRYEAHSILISIENIGLESATNVKIKWYIDIAEIVSRISFFLPTGYEIYNGRDFISIDNKESKKSLFYTSIEEALIEYDYVLPRKDEKFNLSPSIPNQIINLYTAYYLFKNNLIDGPNNELIYHDDFSELSPIKLEVKYSDVAGNKYKKRFQLTLALSLNNFDHEHPKLYGKSTDISYFCNFFVK